MRERRDFPGRGGRARRRSLWLPAGILLAIAAPFTACGDRLDETGGTVDAPDPERAADTGRGDRIDPLPDSVLVLEGSASSLDDLLRTVERGLGAHDTTRLDHLMIDEREYRDILYPAFPASRPPINASFETLWVLQYPDSYRGLRKLLERYGGRDVRVTSIRFDAPDQDFVNFVLHESSRVDAVVDGDTLRDIRLFGSVVRVGDQWKVLTYPDDPDDSS